MFDFPRRIAAKPSYVEPNQRARRLVASSRYHQRRRGARRVVHAGLLHDVVQSPADEGNRHVGDLGRQPLEEERPLVSRGLVTETAFEIYKHLTQERWATQSKGNSAANGTYALRAFYGDYEVTVTHAGKTQKATAKWRQDGDKVVVKLP